MEFSGKKGQEINPGIPRVIFFPVLTFDPHNTFKSDLGLKLIEKSVTYILAKKLYHKFLKCALWYSNVFSTNNESTLNPHH